MQHSDFFVKNNSSCLDSISFDLIVSGSIAAVESVKLVRSLRRLGAKVYPHLTTGAKQFITEAVLEWACEGSDNKKINNTNFHLSTNHSLIIAPASANTITKLNLGIADNPPSALALSYLGNSRPIFILPNMHHSMFKAPIIQQHLDSLRNNPWITELDALFEEDKLKMPPTVVLADQIAHHYNKRSIKQKKVLLTMGPTREYVDDVRVISNISTGKLGKLIAEELYRLGFETHVVCGPAEYKPNTYTKLYPITTNKEMLEATDMVMSQGIDACIFSAAVSDYTPTERFDGKIISTSNHLTINLSKAKKVIGHCNPHSGIKVGFKLECSLNDKDYLDIANKYLRKYSLSLLVINDLKYIKNNDQHLARIFEQKQNNLRETRCSTKKEIAQHISQHISHELKVL